MTEPPLLAGCGGARAAVLLLVFIRISFVRRATYLGPGMVDPSVMDTETVPYRKYRKTVSE